MHTILQERQEDSPWLFVTWRNPRWLSPSKTLGTHRIKKDSCTLLEVTNFNLENKGTNDKAVQVEIENSNKNKNALSMALKAAKFENRVDKESWF